METVKVSKKYQVVIPEKFRQKANIKPGDKMIVMAKHGVLQYVPVRPLAKTKGMVLGLDKAGLRDETFTNVPSVFDLAETSKLSKSKAFKQEGALISHRLKVPMADALIMATSKRLRLPCVTDDPHFSEMKTIWIQMGNLITREPEGHNARLRQAQLSNPN